MASQSLPPPPLSCSTPPPIDFGPPDDDEDPFPEEDDDPSEELPSFGHDDDAIPVPGDSFYLSSSSLSPPPKAVEAAKAVTTPQLVNSSSRPADETIYIDRVAVVERDEMMNGSKQESDTAHQVPPTSTASIHDLLNKHQHHQEQEEEDNERVAPESVNSVFQISESEAESRPDSESPESGKTVQQETEVETEWDNPPSLNLDVLPVLETPEDFGDFSKAVIRDCEEPDEERTSSPLGVESPTAEQRTVFVEEDKTPVETENIPKDDDDNEDNFGDFVENKVVAEGAPKGQSNQEHPKPETCDLEAEEEDKEEEEIPIPSLNEDEEDEEFDAFTDFACQAARTIDTAADVPAAVVIEAKDSEAFEADFDQFADFDHFSQSAGEKEKEKHQAIGTTAEETTIVRSSGDVEEEEDDEFGDFTSSAPAPHFHAVLPVEDKPPPIDISHVDTVLLTMFPSEGTVSIGGGSSSHAAAKILIATSGYETTALTNEYHWSKSHSNKCLVKCLGIDTRNILHGTKWNSEMPRFAANLGFSPLQPMKPMTAAGGGGGGGGGILKPTPAAAGGAAAVSSGLPGVGVDVPAAQFDWDSSGLVNPLHASQAHTYLLDLEQLKVVVVASLELENTKTTTASHTTTTTTPTHRHATGWSSAMLLLRGDDNTTDTLSRGQKLLMMSGEEEKEVGEEDLRLYEEYASFRSRVVEVQGREWRGGKEERARRVEPESCRVEAVIKAEELERELNIRSVGDGEEASTEEVDEEFVVTVPAPPIAGAAEEPVSGDVHPGPFMSPLRETHIFTPTIKGGALPESREVINTVAVCGAAGGLPSTDAAEGIAVKEYRDVEYDPSRFLAAGGLGRAAEGKNGFGQFVGTEGERSTVVGSMQGGVESSHFSIGAPEEDGDDDFSDFQSTPAATTTPSLAPSIKSTTGNPLAVLSVSGLSAMVGAGGGGRLQESAAQDSHILMPSILMPRPANAAQVVSMNNAESIRWPDQSEQIAQSELQRIEQMFGGNRGGGTSQKQALGVNGGGRDQQQQEEGEDEWSDFVSVQGVVMSPKRSPVVRGGGVGAQQQQQREPSHKVGAANEDNDWTDFVSSAPQTTGPNFTPWGASSPAYGQFIQQAPITSRPTTTRFGGGAPEMQFVDPSPFFISSTAAGLQSVFRGGQGQGAKKGSGSGGGGK